MIDCFIPFRDVLQVSRTIEGLKKEEIVGKIFLLRLPEAAGKSIQGCEAIDVKSINCTDAVMKMSAAASAEYSLIYTKFTDLSFGRFALERIVAIGEMLQ